VAQPLVVWDANYRYDTRWRETAVAVSRRCPNYGGDTTFKRTVVAGCVDE